MLCSEFDTRTQALLDERKSPEQDPDLLKHAQNCPQCNSQLVLLSKLFDSLDLLEIPELPDNFAQRVLDNVNQATPARLSPRSIPTWLVVATTVAAVLLLAVLPVTWFAAKNRHVVAQPGSDMKVSDQESGSSALAQSTSPSDAVEEGWMVSGASFLELYPEETRRRHREQVNQIADDLRPITTPFTAAMTAIRRSLTPGRTEAKGQPRASLQHTRSSDGIS